MKILLVDDDVRISTLYKAWLELEGHEVLLSHDSVEASGLLAERPEVLVSSIDLRIGSGVDLAAEARQQRPNMPVYFCTERPPGDEEVRDARTLGNVFQKEGRPNELLQELNILSSQASVRRRGRNNQRFEQTPNEEWGGGKSGAVLASGTGVMPCLPMTPEAVCADPVQKSRREYRVDVALGLRLRFGSINQILTTRSINISRQGLLLTLPKKPADGSSVHVQVELNGQRISLKGKVVRIQERASEDFAVGVELIDPSDEWLTLCDEVQQARQNRLNALLAISCPSNAR